MCHYIFLFYISKILLKMLTSSICYSFVLNMVLKICVLLLWQLDEWIVCDKPRQYIKKWRCHFANKGLYIKAIVFPVVMYGFESWTIKKAECQRTKNWSFRTEVLEKTLKCPLDSTEFKPVRPKGINPEYSLERQVLKLKLQYLGHLMQRANSLEKTLMLGKNWVQEEMGMIEVEMVGWHHWLNGHESEQSSEDSEGQGSLACCSPWGRKESDTTEWLNWTEAQNIT